MLRFLLLALTLCLGCTLAIGAAVAVGRTQPPSEAARWFHMDDCETPCFMGVTLGKAYFDETKRHVAEVIAPPGYTLSLRNHFLKTTENLEEIGLTLTNTAQLRDDLYISFSAYQGVTSSVGLFTNDGYENLPAIADVIRAYGLPTCAYETSSGGKRRLIGYIVDSSRWLEVHVNDPITWGSPISGLWMDKNSTARDNPCGDLPARWHGLSAQYPWRNNN